MNSSAPSGTPISIDVCVCTFRREHIVDTLRSIARQEGIGKDTMRIIVADNDDEPSAQETVIRIAQETGLNLNYIHAPSHNISIARNACLDAATAPYVAFLDDDEEASPEWLSSLLAVLMNELRDVILGPVQAQYNAECPVWIRAGDFHSTYPVWKNGRIVTGYVGNVLFRRDFPALKSLRFDNNLGLSGGEDTAFFAQAYSAGANIGFAAKAVAIEPIPKERATFAWLLKRRFRSGQTHGRILLEEQGAGVGNRLKNIFFAASKAGLCFVVSPLYFFRKDRMAAWALRAALHCGVVCRLLGKKELEMYGKENT